MLVDDIEGDIILQDGSTFDTDDVLDEDDDENKVIFRFDENNNKPENDEKPLVIRPETIGGATIKGKGELVFKDVENVWLYGINFRYNPQSEKGAIVTLVEAGKCSVARCDFHTRHGDFPQDGHEDRDVDETTDNNLAKAEKMIDSFEIRDDISNISANVISY